MKKILLVLMITILIAGCAAQVEKTSNATKETAVKETITVEEKTIQPEQQEKTETKTQEIAEIPEQTETTVNLEVGETKTITLDDRQYKIKLLSISNRARFVINGEHTQELMLKGTDTLKDQTKIELVRFFYNGAELKIKTPPEREQIDTGALTGTEPQTLATGIFQSVEKRTAGHAEIISTAEGEYVLQMQGFLTEPGAGLHIYLVNQDISDGLEVAKLTTIQGGQKYTIPKETDLNKYNKIVIYSKSEEKVYGEAIFS